MGDFCECGLMFDKKTGGKMTAQKIAIGNKEINFATGQFFMNHGALFACRPCSYSKDYIWGKM